MTKDSGPERHRQVNGAHWSSQLFLLRVWQAGDSGQDLQGKVQHTVTGQVHHFTGSSELVAILRRLLFQKDVDDAD